MCQYIVSNRRVLWQNHHSRRGLSPQSPVLFRGETTSSFDSSDFRTVGAALFRIVILANVFETLQVTFGAALRGVGDTGYMLKVTLAAECAGWIPLIILVLALRPDIACLWWTIVIWRGICAALLVHRWHSGAWKKVQLI